MSTSQHPICPILYLFEGTIGHDAAFHRISSIPHVDICSDQEVPLQTLGTQVACSGLGFRVPCFSMLRGGGGEVPNNRGYFILVTQQ